MRKLLLLLLLISIKSVGQTLESDRLALVAIYTATSTGTNVEYGGPNFNDITGWNVPGSPGDSPCGWTGVTCEGGRVTKVDLSMFQVHGPIAPEIGNLSELKYLNLQGDGAEFYPWIGEIPSTLGNLTKLEYLNLSYNRIGIANMGVIGSLTNLKELAVTPLGEIPTEWANLTNLEVLFLGTWEAFGGPTVFAVPGFLTSFTKLRELYLMQQLKGTLPALLGSISNLEVLEITGNYELTGQIPPEIGNLSKLKRLALRQNFNMNGPIPIELGNLTNLEELQLGDTPFTGSIPVQINNLTKLARIVIGSTGLGGTFPAIDNLTALTYLDIRYNHFKGPLPSLANVPVSGSVFIGSNAFTFAGLEENFDKLDGALGQAKIPIASQILWNEAQLSVDVGGTLTNNTYKWYKNNALIATKTGNNLLTVTEQGLYRVEVTNSVVTGLKLVSYDYNYVKLPVTLVSFEGKSESNQTKLTWKTTSETNNKGFEIERSADARTFEKIGFVDGSGDTKENQFYHFTDLNPLSSAYYRLKQLDYDGKFEYSKVIAVRADKEAIKIYPNPAQAEVTVEGTARNALVSVFTPDGRQIVERAELSGGKLDVKHLKEGIYTIKIGDVAKKLLIKR